ADKGQCLIVDPALATGATAVAAIDLLKSVGVERIKFMCIFSSLTGISAVHSKHPDVTIFTASYSDEPLNDKGYIYTAAGDAGDRICGTVSYKPWPR
ncbi:MAG: hypothetical protein IKY06_07550, partial [Clostridia bacterium]|nr:hypothetical protein [Clostridia bacterium]